MSRKLLFLVACSTLCLAPSAFAEGVVKWVDANGVTHFGDAQFAPQAGAEQIELQEANGMDVPDLRVLDRTEAPRALNGVVVKRQHTKNPRGWRGYWNRPADMRSSQRSRR